MSKTDLQLSEKGSLPRPGPLGRLLRLALGFVVLYGFVYEIWDDRGMLTSGDFGPYGLIYNGLIIGLLVVSYVINIGFSRDWKKWPLAVSGVLLGGLALYDQLAFGDWTGAFFGTGFFIWSMYIFTHLGLAFVLAGLLGTPGCEMRAFHDLFSKATGIEVKEHFCPAGFIQGLDKWEAKQPWRKGRA